MGTHATKFRNEIELLRHRLVFVKSVGQTRAKWDLNVDFSRLQDGRKSHMASMKGIQ